MRRIPTSGFYWTPASTALSPKHQHNAVFIRVVLDARDAVATQSQLINLVAHRRPASNREHQRIVDAIASGSFEDSQEAMRDHLARVARAMSKISTPDS